MAELRRMGGYVKRLARRSMAWESRFLSAAREHVVAEERSHHPIPPPTEALHCVCCTTLRLRMPHIDAEREHLLGCMSVALSRPQELVGLSPAEVVSRLCVAMDAVEDLQSRGFSMWRLMTSGVPFPPVPLVFHA